MKTSLALFVAVIAIYSLSAKADPRDSQSVPMRMDSIGTYLVPCSIASSVGECIVDIGSRTSQVSDIPATHDLPKAGFLDVHTIGQAEREPLVDAGLFKIGNILAEPHSIITIGNNYQQLPDYLGVLGAPQVVGHDLIFNFKPPMSISKITNADRAQVKTTGRLFPGIGDKRRLELEVFVGGNSVHAMFDTHCSTIFSTQFVASHPELFQVKETTQAGDVSGASATVTIYKLLKPVCIAGNCINIDQIFTIDQSIMGEFGHGQIEMLIGWEALDGAVWSFDYTNGIYSYSPAQK